MARIRALKEKGGRVDTLWTPKTPGRPPAMALWEVTVSVGRDSNGKYRQRSERLRGTYTQAKDKADDMEVHVGRTRTPEATGKTVGDALDAYIGHAEAMGRAGKTIIGYRSLANVIKARIGSVKLRQLGPYEISGYYDWLRSTRDVSLTTVSHHHMLISQTLNMAIDNNWLLPPNPAKRARPPSPDLPRPSAPSPAEAQVFIRALASRPETHDKAALLLLAGITGCRRGEVVGWRWSDFSAEAGALTVRRAISMGQAGPEEKGTKTKRERRLAMGAGTVAVLATQWDRYSSRCRDFGVVPDPDSFVFSGRVDHSTPLNPNSVTQTFRRLRERLVAELAKSNDIELQRRAKHLEAVKLGHFRHFAATQMAGSGIDLKTASARMGHDGAVFMRHYAAVIDSNDQEAGALLESLLMPAWELPAAPGAVAVTPPA